MSSETVREFRRANLNYVAVASATDAWTPEIEKALDACTEAFRKIGPADLIEYIMTDVPTPEDRAAVGRLATYVENQGDAFGSCGDIEAAQRVENGGGNG